ncbi:hypothetical protein TSAR_015470 [Trichomalopsis sarcophagae]|uniref:Uncharacterized protein n=1 Tax=Trichomalopsis sarcophagae TaxID=543379 RepID=A0A232FB63_9HYME|nr:hypothetical protein TSAR_015470 [Trichomalopsis sarcophagae]
MDLLPYTKDRRLDFDTARMFSGFKLDDHPNCSICSDATEDVEHVFCECSRYNQKREELEIYLQIRLTPKSIITAMLISKDGSCSQQLYSRNSLKSQERRRRQKKTKRKRTWESQLLPLCLDADEDVEHVFCECSRYQQERENLEDYLQTRVTPESIMKA